MENPLVDAEFLLEKYPGKGGWTYAAIPVNIGAKSSPFGMVRVKGTIDEFQILSLCLMPMGNGQLFLPVKAEIRKRIKKKEGDFVRICLFLNTEPIEIPEELRLCFQDFPKEHEAFLSLSNGAQKVHIDWIYSAKTDKTKVERIATMLSKLASQSNSANKSKRETTKTKTHI